MMLEPYPLVLAVPHGTLHGELLLPDHARGIVLYVAASGTDLQAAHGHSAEDLHACGFGTLAIDLLIESERHFADADRHLPHLADRLLAVIHQLHRRMELEEIPTLPLGLIAAYDATPLAVRVAAQRDQDIGALVCHGGLVDLAGLQYLKVLQAPLLLLTDSDDTVASRNLQRARQYMPGVVETEQLPTAPDQTTRAATQHAARWFQRYLGR